MPAPTTMVFYTGIALECQRCYQICRLDDAVVRRHCPHCGLDIGNWQAVLEEVKKRTAPASEAPEDQG